MTTYHFVAASERFLTEEEPLEEVLKERRRHYAEQGKEIDFWLVRRPAFLQAPEMASVMQKCRNQRPPWCPPTPPSSPS